MAFIDYGAVVFKNGEHINSGEFFMDMEGAVGWKCDNLYDAYFAYIGDSHITAAFYRTLCVVYVDGEFFRYIHGTDDSKDLWRNFGGRKSLRYQVGDVRFRVKQIADCVYHFSAVLRGDVYHVIYGYGIDPSKDTWDAVKVRYLGKKTVKKVDRLYKRLGGLK